MSIDAEQERRFYDQIYSRLLALPAQDLKLDRNTLLADLNDPLQPIYERRRLFHLTFAYLERLPLKELRVLDYGCGPGDWGLWMASEGARVTSLDLSPVAVELVMKRAAASGLADRVDGASRDASDLSCFVDGEFDLIFGCAAVHHTLKYANALEELVRVLKPGGRLVLAETLGDNAILNALRRMRAQLAGEPEEAGEEIILGEREIELLRRRFESVEVMPLNLVAMGKRLMRGRFANPVVRVLLAGLERVDALLLGVLPFLRRYCGEALIVAVK